MGETRAATADVTALRARLAAPGEEPPPATLSLVAQEVDPGQLDVSRAALHVAGPSGVYVTSIMYAGSEYSVLLEHGGANTANLTGLYTAAGKLIPDSLDLTGASLLKAGS